jgi:hypothetical protein
MSAAEIVALATATAGLLTAASQWFRLFGPRRNGGSAWVHYLERRLTVAETALGECLDRVSPRHRTRADRWPLATRQHSHSNTSTSPPPHERNPD